jgi:threonine dehydratase
MGSFVSRDDVLAAREAVGDRLHRTPLFSSRSASEHVGADVRLKAELFQRTGSFKPRGMLAVLASLSEEEKRRGVVTWSAGNAGQGAAYAAAVHGVACRVFMWRTANPLKVEATRAYGADADLESEGPAEAHDRLLAYVERTGATFVHPFDDPVLHAGYGGLGLEIVEDVREVDTIVCPIGGGGLITGVASAVDCRVVGVEPEGSPTMTAALEAGNPVSIRPASIADGLGAPFASDRTLAACRERVDGVVLVTEEEIKDAMRFLYGRAKLAVEPAGAASTAALLAGKVTVDPGSTVVAIVSGGNADPRVAAAILAEADES